MKKITLPAKEFRALCKVYSDREIAIALGVSIDQVRHHRRRLFVVKTIKGTRAFKCRAMRGTVLKVK